MTRRIHVIRIYVAQGRPGVFEIQYKHSIARRNPMKEKIENGMSDMIDYRVQQTFDVGVEVWNRGNVRRSFRI